MQQGTSQTLVTHVTQVAVRKITTACAWQHSQAFHPGRHWPQTGLAPLAADCV